MRIVIDDYFQTINGHKARFCLTIARGDITVPEIWTDNPDEVVARVQEYLSDSDSRKDLYRASTPPIAIATPESAVQQSTESDVAELEELEPEVETEDTGSRRGRSRKGK